MNVDLKCSIAVVGRKPEAGVFVPTFHVSVDERADPGRVRIASGPGLCSPMLEPTWEEFDAIVAAAARIRAFRQETMGTTETEG